MAKLYETITAENWCKNTLADGAGRRCLVGHFEDVKRWSKTAGERWEPKWLALMEATRAVVGHGEIVHFNNHPDTTVEDIIRVCKVADV